MSTPAEVAVVSLLGLGTTSSAIGGAAIGLYLPMSKRLLACILAFAAGAAIDEGVSLVVLPTVAGFLFALYLALAEAFV